MLGQSGGHPLLGMIQGGVDLTNITYIQYTMIYIYNYIYTIYHIISYNIIQYHVMSSRACCVIRRCSMGYFPMCFFIQQSCTDTIACCPSQSLLGNCCRKCTPFHHYQIQHRHASRVSQAAHVSGLPKELCDR